MHKYNKKHLDNIKLSFENKTGVNVTEQDSVQITQKANWGFGLGAVVGFVALALLFIIGVTGLDKITKITDKDVDVLVTVSSTDTSEILEELSSETTTQEDDIELPDILANPEVTIDEWPAEYDMPTPEKIVILIDGNYENGKICFAAPVGTPVYAIRDAKVIKVSKDDDLGRIICLDLGDGRTVCYAHLDSISVSYGQEVSKGEEIGNVGVTGKCTGPVLTLIFSKE